MSNVLSQEEGIKKVTGSRDRMAVAKIPCREKVTKAVAGEEYFCSDEGKMRVAEEGMAYITRELPDGKVDTYMNKKGSKYKFEDGHTWDTLAAGESAYGKLGAKEFDRSAIWVAGGTESMAVWDEVQKAQGTNAFLTTIYENAPAGADKWSATQTVINNNACDTHPIDTARKDQDGNPVVIGEMPLTAAPELREKEFRAYVAQNYDGKTPEHLLPVMRNINAEKAAKTGVYVQTMAAAGRQNA